MKQYPYFRTLVYTFPHYCTTTKEARRYASLPFPRAIYTHPGPSLFRGNRRRSSSQRNSVLLRTHLIQLGHVIRILAAIADDQLQMLGGDMRVVQLRDSQCDADGVPDLPPVQTIAFEVLHRVVEK